MASTAGMYSKANPMEETVMRGVRRSRFSFHFGTRRTRRWLLVQWISVPVVGDKTEQPNTQETTEMKKKNNKNYQTLLSDYNTQAWLRRVI